MSIQQDQTKKSSKAERGGEPFSGPFVLEVSVSAESGEYRVVQAANNDQGDNDANTITVDLRDFTGRVKVHQAVKNENSSWSSPATVSTKDDSTGVAESANTTSKDEPTPAPQHHHVGSKAVEEPLRSNSLTGNSAQGQKVHVDDAIGLSDDSTKSSCSEDQTLIQSKRKCDDCTASRLHELCALRNVELEDLEQALAMHPESASTPDGQGRLPLHILGRNEVLVSETAAGREVATAFGWSLMKAHPQAITTLDSSGRMPFVEVVEERVRWLYYETQQERSSLLIAQDPTQITSRHISRNSSGAASNDSLMQSHFNVHSGGRFLSSVTRTSELDESPESFRRSFPAVRLSTEVEWCLSMMSLAMDGLGGREDGFAMDKRRLYHRAENSNQRARADLVTHLAGRVPAILKTILLIEDDNGGNPNGGTRHRVLQMSIVRSLMLCPESVDDWLVYMLRQRGIPSHRAVDYLLLLSRSTVHDYMGGFKDVLDEDLEVFREKRKCVFGKIASLHGIVVSLLVLEDEEQERAVTTSCIWFVMQQNITRPVVVCLMLMDFVLHLVILMAFRTLLHVGVSDTIVNSDGEIGWFDDKDLDGRTTFSNSSNSFLVVGLTSLYYVIRKVFEALAILSISKQAFRSYITNLWTIFDWVTVVLTFTAFWWWAVTANDEAKGYQVGFYTAVLGLLWIKVLSFLKVVNRSMATFVISLVKIIRDMRSFALVLASIILMFGDMFHVVVFFKDHGVFCEDSNNTLSDPAQDFCSNNLANSYLRVYGLLLGDFELQDYRETLGMLLLFLTISAVGIIIMLNLLIAIMATSYEESLERSFLLFGRARIAFVARSRALEKLLRPSAPCSHLSPRHSALHLAWRTLRHVVVVCMVFLTTPATLYLVERTETSVIEERYLLVALFLVMLCFLIFSSVVVFLYALEFWFGGCLPETVIGWISGSLGKHTAWVCQAIAAGLFGLTYDDADWHVEDEK